MNEKFECKYMDICSGCQIAHLKKEEQIDYKKRNFLELWDQAFDILPEIEFVRPVESRFRDKMDITISNETLEKNSPPSQQQVSISISPEQLSTQTNDSSFQKIGFYKKDSKEILDIESCPLNSNALAKLYSQLRTIHFPIQKGSLRIRVSPSGLKGLWIDFSNIDIKKILDEKTVLLNLYKIFDIIEVGQKRKKLALANNELKLMDPELNPWFETYDKNLNSIPLNMNVGGFSQTGFTTNKELIKQLLGVLNDTKLSAVSLTYKETENKKHLSKTYENHEQQIIENYNSKEMTDFPLCKPTEVKDGSKDSIKSCQQWLELCSGSGNLTFPLLSLFQNVIATELDQNAIESLKNTAKKYGIAATTTSDMKHNSDLNKQKTDHSKLPPFQLRIEKINIHRPSQKLEELFSNVDGILADPPRSGLQGFLDVISHIPKENLPKNFIYVSCFSESLISDLKILCNVGYKVKKIIGVDQFPHSTHCEWISHLTI